jgi:hypothetical protein
VFVLSYPVVIPSGDEKSVTALAGENEISLSTHELKLFVINDSSLTATADALIADPFSVLIRRSILTA